MDELKIRVFRKGSEHNKNRWLHGCTLKSDISTVIGDRASINATHDGNNSFFNMLEMLRHPRDGHEISIFFGLYDKKGQEIYTGDIIKLTYIKNSKKINYVMKVIWCERNAGFHLVSHEQQEEISFFSLSSSNMEVIGNVFENPELLEK